MKILKKQAIFSADTSIKDSDVRRPDAQWS
jgi:hypothetical protein